MITESEAIQLARIRDAEADFYAEVLFLVMARAKMGVITPSLESIADAIISSYRDMNERVIP